MCFDVTPLDSPCRAITRILRPRTYRQCSDESMDKSSEYANVNLARFRPSEGSTQAPVGSANCRPGVTTHRYQHLRIGMRGFCLQKSVFRTCRRMWFGLRTDNLAKSAIDVAVTLHASCKPPRLPALFPFAHLRGWHCLVVDESASLQRNVACGWWRCRYLEFHDFLAVDYVSATTISQHQLSIVLICLSSPQRSTCIPGHLSGRRAAKREKTGTIRQSQSPCRAVDQLMMRSSGPQAFFAVVSGLRPQNHKFSSFCPFLQHGLIGRFGEHAMLQFILPICLSGRNYEASEHLTPATSMTKPRTEPSSMTRAEPRTCLPHNDCVMIHGSETLKTLLPSGVQRDLDSSPRTL
jgi:hypothetical protein